MWLFLKLSSCLAVNYGGIFCRRLVIIYPTMECCSFTMGISSYEEEINKNFMSVYPSVHSSIFNSNENGHSIIYSRILSHSHLVSSTRKRRDIFRKICSKNFGVSYWKIAFLLTPRYWWLNDNWHTLKELDVLYTNMKWYLSKIETNFTLNFQ